VQQDQESGLLCLWQLLVTSFHFFFSKISCLFSGLCRYIVNGKFRFHSGKTPGKFSALVKRSSSFLVVSVAGNPLRSTEKSSLKVFDFLFTCNKQWKEQRPPPLQKVLAKWAWICCAFATLPLCAAYLLRCCLADSCLLTKRPWSESKACVYFTCFQEAFMWWGSTTYWLAQ
jgi:hypothetical protein